MQSPSKKPFTWKRVPPNDRRAVLRLGSAGHRWDVRLIGLVNRSRFAVSHPYADGKLVFVKEGDRFDVANFDGSVVSHFSSTVLHVSLGDDPSLSMSLPPPEERRREVVRRARRAPVLVPCSVRYGGGEGELRAGFTGDLSDTGAQVAIEHPLPAGVDRVDLSLRVPVLGEAVTILARAAIRSQSPDPRPEMPATLLGLQFEEIERPTKLALSLFVAERLLAEADDVFGAIR
ncbi:MAG TPA: flagellar brake protein [Burkholderiaceae bacterium]|nr:flagellar brake protein [Burkholderiaceae bacterium]